ncbi:MAG: carboxypeptidase regulatory-like domain-containing protein, partial [Polyangiaceae bacterium]
VYDPAGKVPLYNVIVYVPTGPLPALAAGATCDTCGSEVVNPLASALTDAKGHFSLSGVPSGVPISLVMQIGKWRREITIPAVAPCVDTPLTDPNMMRLPRNQREGNIPRIALATGGADPLECLLRKIGIEDSEFTTAGGSGRVHLYAGSGVPTQVPPIVPATRFAPSLNGGAAFADAQALWSSVTNLQAYDLLLLACEGQANAGTKPPAALQAMYAYESLGGRVFASHWHDYWFSNGPAPLPSTGSWTDLTPPPPDPSDGTIDTSFPKGQALHDWLANVGGLDSTGELPIKEPKHNLNSVGGGAQQWITLKNPNAMPAGQTAVEYMTFNTPLDVDAGAQCGRVVYS